MPLLNNQEEWEQWIKEHEGPIIKIRSQKLHDPYVAYDGEPKEFPCWMTYYHFSPDCGTAHYWCEFIYQNENGQWDLETYEREIGWG
jgi:hypothetical protein